MFYSTEVPPHTTPTQVLTDTGHAIIASLTERVPHAKVWFRVKAGQQTTITSRHGCTDVVGYTVDVCAKAKAAFVFTEWE